MSGVASLYGGVDMAQVMYGQNARHVPAWMYVQNHGQGTIGLVGASAGTEPHPLRYGTDWAHHFIVGELIVRPHLVIGTNALQGMGMGNLYLGNHEFGEMLADGAVVAGSEATLRRVRKQWEG